MMKDPSFSRILFRKDYRERTGNIVTTVIKMNKNLILVTYVTMMIIKIV